MGIAMLFVGLGFFCVLLWNCAAYALPAFAGFSMGWWSLNHGAGIGCVIVGLVTGIATFALGRATLMSPNAVVRWLVIAIFALPAAYAGYSILLELGDDIVPSPFWRYAFASLGAIAVGLTAINRLVDGSRRSARIAL